MHRGEHGDRAADTERERQRREDGEARRAAQAAKPEFHVGDEGVDRGGSHHRTLRVQGDVTAGLPHRLEVAEPLQRPHPRRRRIESVVDVASRLHLDVEVEFSVDVALIVWPHDPLSF